MLNQTSLVEIEKYLKKEKGIENRKGMRKGSQGQFSSFERTGA